MTPRISIAPRTTARSWTRIDAGIARDAFVNVVREDPVSRGLLYAGTERGMFVSFDDGAHWQSLEQNLPMTSVRDIDVHGADLVIATHGRGFWIMDDVSALRQMGSMHDERSHCSNPSRRSACAPRGSPARPAPKMSLWRPILRTAPSSTMRCRATIAGPVTLTILDAQNHPVRSFSSADRASSARPVEARVRERMAPRARHRVGRARDASLRLEPALPEPHTRLGARTAEGWRVGTARPLHRGAQRRRAPLRATSAGRAGSAGALSPAQRCSGNSCWRG